MSLLGRLLRWLSRTTFRKRAIEEEGARIERQYLWRRDEAPIDEAQVRLRVETLRFATCEHGELRALCTVCWPG